jgi:hypothetical protein
MELGTEQELIAALLKLAFGKQINKAAYKEIKTT